MSHDFYERFYIKLHWCFSKVALDVIKYLDSVPCDYKVERKCDNYYEIKVAFETEEEFEPVREMLPQEFGVIVYR